MGAEMLIQSIGFKAKGRFLIDDEWAASAFAQARRAIEAMDEERLAEINDPQGSDYAGVEECKRQLLNDLAEVEVAVRGEYRQAATVEAGNGVILLLSGGMSWGNPPTELFECMTRLLEADVLPDARWPEQL